MDHTSPFSQNIPSKDCLCVVTSVRLKCPVEFNILFCWLLHRLAFNTKLLFFPVLKKNPVLSSNFKTKWRLAFSQTRSSTHLNERSKQHDVCSNNTGTCFDYITVALGQPARVSKEVSLHGAGADWLKLICQSQRVGRPAADSEGTLCLLIDPPVCPALCNSLHLTFTHSVIFILFCGAFVLLRVFFSPSPLCPSSKDIHRTYQLRLFLNWSIFLYTRFIQWVSSLKSVW